MKFNPETHHRRSIRLKNYDYIQPGAYFITIVTNKRQCLFGKIENGVMRLNEFGEIVRDEWFKSNEIRREIVLNDYEFVVMPNHIHGIVWIVENNDMGTNGNIIVGANGRSPLQKQSNKNQPPTHSDSPLIRMSPKSISSFVAGFKSAVTKQINQLRQTPGIPVWQRNYYEHITRNDDELQRIREYIINNPINWELDENYERN